MEGHGKNDDKTSSVLGEQVRPVNNTRPEAIDPSIWEEDKKEQLANQTSTKAIAEPAEKGSSENIPDNTADKKSPKQANETPSEKTTDDATMLKEKTEECGFAS